MLQTVAVLVEDHPGILTRVMSMLQRRSFKIESLTVGRTDKPGVTQITMVVDGNRVDTNRLLNYLSRLVDVVCAENMTLFPMVSRDLGMIKVGVTPSTRAEVMQLVDVYRARVVDVANDSLIIEITGNPEKIQSFVEVLRPYGIMEMVRSGAVAMGRGNVVFPSMKEPHTQAGLAV